MACSHHKHLGLTLDKTLIFQHHLKEKLAKANKGIGVIKRLHSIVSRPTQPRSQGFLPFLICEIAIPGI